MENEDVSAQVIPKIANSATAVEVHTNGDKGNKNPHGSISGRFRPPMMIMDPMSIGHVKSITFALSDFTVTMVFVKSTS